MNSLSLAGCSLFLGAWGALVGCGATEGGAAPIERADYPSAAARLLCESRGSCCQGSGIPFDVARCKTTLTTELGQEFEEDLAGRQVDYDAAAAGACLAGVENLLECGEVSGDDVPEACRTVVRGRIGEGQPCQDRVECKRAPDESADCYSENGVGPSLCVVERSGSSTADRGNLGDACHGTCSGSGACGGGLVAVPTSPPGGQPPPIPAVTYACYKSEGLYCDFDSTAGPPTCRPTVAPGAACSAEDSCSEGSFCDNTSSNPVTTPQPGTCTRPKANGEPCETDSSCQSDFCNSAGECSQRSLSAEECREYQ